MRELEMVNSELIVRNSFCMGCISNFRRLQLFIKQNGTQSTQRKHKAHHVVTFVKNVVAFVP